MKDKLIKLLRGFTRKEYVGLQNRLDNLENKIIFINADNFKIKKTGYKWWGKKKI
jgi:tetrahydromethanopterin S-methyltransferase subunit G